MIQKKFRIFADGLPLKTKKTYGYNGEDANLAGTEERVY